MSVDGGSPNLGRDASYRGCDRTDSPRASLLKRIGTAFRSFMVVRSLTQAQVDSFMKSYIIYDLDWANEKEMIATLGKDYQQRVGECLADYYSVLNHLCAIGELEKMYIPPIMDLKEGISVNQLLYEKSVAKELALARNATVLDLGCGRGRVAAHIARLTGARVTGINIDADQIASGTEYSQEHQLAIDFIQRDFNELPLPLPENHFDGCYQIQAFSLVQDHALLLKEVFRVLKPGARISMLDWVSLPAFDPTCTIHRQLMRNIKPLIGAVGTPTPESMKLALELAGFHVIEMANASIDGLQAPLIERADAYFGAARVLLTNLVRLRLLPAHFKTLFDRLTKDGQSFIEADRARLITTSYHWLAQKPLAQETELMEQQLTEASASDASMAASSADAASAAESSAASSTGEALR